ncbi:polyamine-modulated factor 1-binding protein 1-like isoform X2 [Petaurus breviceps papuanus]|uniref:polyamine-modulated factor 1-binding protein 1-like isoform X2 n=1 Tax=Petaurus breviceps papuanus TaxID=3040969 RepID=UPI0036DF33A7
MSATLFFNDEQEDRLSDTEDEDQQSRQRVHRDSCTRKHSAAEKKIQQQKEKEDRLSDTEDEPQQSQERVHRDSSTRKHSAAEKMMRQQDKKSDEVQCYPRQCDSPTRKLSAIEKIQQQAEKEKEKVGKLEEENEVLRDALKHCTKQLESAANKLETTEKATEMKENEVAHQTEAPTHVQKDLQKAEKQEQKNNLKTTHCSPESAQKDSLKEALEKAKLEAVMLRQELQQTWQKKFQLEEETCVYQLRMKKLNGELKKLQDFHQQIEEEVEALIRLIEDMNYQLAFWQRTHENDLHFLAAKDEQLVVFKVEMASLKENLREEEKKNDFLEDEISVLKERYISTSCEVEALRNTLGSAHKDTWRLHQESERVASDVSDVHHWVKEQNHLHNVMVHLKHENKKLRKEIDDRRQQNDHLMVRGIPPGVSQRETQIMQRNYRCLSKERL